MKHYWTWPIACYLFLGGLGGGMLFLAGVLHLVLGFAGAPLAFGVIIAICMLGFGCLLLVFELGQPKVFLRVFTAATAIIKWGAVMLSIAMIAAVLYVMFYLPTDWNLPWMGLSGIADPMLAIAMIFGLGICIYTGVLLSSLKSKPFWNTPVLPVLFTVSALSTASALHSLLVCAWPCPATLENAVSGALQHELLHSLDLVLVIVEVVTLLLYVVLMYASSNLTAKAVARRWLSGRTAGLFWGGMVAGGLALPFLCYLTEGIMSTVIGPVLVLLGGLLLRFLVVFADDRRRIPGEERYYARLPKGDEQFLHTWQH
jgi:protein NrfD